MTPILFYGVPSGCSLGSIVALEWLEIPYQLCRVEMPADVSSDDYKRINPVAETPALITETGDIVSESMAILNHLGPYGFANGLAFAQGSAEFDRLNQTLAFLNTTFFNAFSPLWYSLEHAAQGTEKQALVQYGRFLVQKAHANLEQMLGDGTWLLVERRTFADAYFLGIARWTHYHDVIDRGNYPRLQRLYERLEADAAVVFAHGIERGEPAVSTGGFAGELALSETLDRSQQIGMMAAGK